MKICSVCGKEIDDNALTCPCCGAAAPVSYPNATAPAPEGGDSSSIGFAVLGAFIPIAGLILYIVNKDTAPRKAKSAGIGALIGVGISIIFSILYVILVILLTVLGMSL